MKSAYLGLLVVGAVWLAPAAKADEWDKRTILTFNESVEIPGRVLPAGSYVFKLANSDSDRTIVQVFTEDERQLLATVLAIPDSRTEPAGKTVVTFEERPSGQPEALHSWFYPGDVDGVQFVYPKSGMQLAAKTEQPRPDPSPAAGPTQETTPTPPVLAPNDDESASPVVLREEGDAVVIAQEEPVVPAEVTEPESDASALPDELPQTAGNFAVIPLLGIALLSGGFFAVREAKKQS